VRVEAGFTLTLTAVSAGSAYAPYLNPGATIEIYGTLTIGGMTGATHIVDFRGVPLTMGPNAILNGRYQRLGWATGRPKAALNIHPTARVGSDYSVYWCTIPDEPEPFVIPAVQYSGRPAVANNGFDMETGTTVRYKFAPGQHTFPSGLDVGSSIYSPISNLVITSDADTIDVTGTLTIMRCNLAGIYFHYDFGNTEVRSNDVNVTGGGRLSTWDVYGRPITIQGSGESSIDGSSDQNTDFVVETTGSGITNINTWCNVFCNKGNIAIGNAGNVKIMGGFAS
jgi:hypothetical protein